VHKRAAEIHHGREVLDGKAIFEELEEKTLDWMRNPNYTCEVVHIPFAFTALANGVFGTPMATALTRPLEVDVSKGPFEMAIEQRVSAHQLASSFHTLFQALEVREDVFAVGPLAKAVGERLEASPAAKGRRKTAPNRISLILVDRSLDLAGPLGCGESTSTLAKLRATLSSLEGQPSDSAVNISSLFGLPQDHPETNLLPPGCLAPSSARISNVGVEELLNERVESLATVYHNLLSAASGAESKDEASVADLEELLKAFVNDEEAIKKHVDALTRALALCDLSSKQSVSKMSRLTELNKRYLKTTTKPKELRGYPVHLAKATRERRSRGLTLEDLLLLTARSYALLPTKEDFYPEDEDRLQSALSEAVVRDYRDGSLGSTLSRAVADAPEVDEILAFRLIKAIFHRFNQLRRSRMDMKSEHTDLVDSGCYRPYLARLLEDIFSEDRRDVVDLEHISGGLGGLLKSGIGMFGVNVARMHPRENPEVWIFVVGGGITAEEVVSSRKLVKDRSSRCRLVLGASSGLTSPTESLASLLLSEPLLTSADE
jgi:hypothetical protein